MKKNRLLLTLAIIALGALVLSSCGEDPVDEPTPNFTYEINDKTVAFTNTSTNATTYSWTFGDDQTSTEESPTHMYDAYGDYDVRLTADGETLKQTISVVKEWPTIAIDGDFSDWADVPVLQAAGDSSGTLVEVKVTYDGAANLLFYVKKTDDPVYILTFFVDTDNDPTTGWNPGEADGAYAWYASNGSDSQLEMIVEEFVDGDPMALGTSIWGYNAEGDIDWPFDDETEGTGVWYDVVTEITGASPSNWIGNEIEFKIPVTAFPGTMSIEQINLYVWGLDDTWTDAGYLPEIMTDPKQSPATFSFQ